MNRLGRESVGVAAILLAAAFGLWLFAPLGGGSGPSVLTVPVSVAPKSGRWVEIRHAALGRPGRAEALGRAFEMCAAESADFVLLTGMVAESVSGLARLPALTAPLDDAKIPWFRCAALPSERGRAAALRRISHGTTEIVLAAFLEDAASSDAERRVRERFAEELSRPGLRRVFAAISPELRLEGLIDGLGLQGRPIVGLEAPTESLQILWHGR